MYVYMSNEKQLQLKMLGYNTYEVNGQISVSEDGHIKDIKYQKGQQMQPCYTGCILNFHTHPHDYQTLYPDHPSTTDYKYIHTATCKLKELSAHLVVTPKYLYVIYYNCPNPLLKIFDVLTISWRIENRFRRVSENWDRSSENFRIEYMQEMRDLGFHIERFEWGDEIQFEIPQNAIFFNLVVYIGLFLCLFFIIKKIFFITNVQ